jgi:hypothetical protein
MYSRRHNKALNSFPSATGTIILRAFGITAEHSVTAQGVFKLKTLLIIIMLLGLAGCNSDINLNLDAVESVTIIYSGDSTVYTTGTNEFENTIKWLKANKNGWESYFVTAPQPEILIRSTDFMLGINKDNAILSYQCDGQYRQIIKPINASAFDFVKN